MVDVNIWVWGDAISVGMVARDLDVILTSFSQLLLLPFPTTWMNAL
jgi:hypothetical protein